MYTHIHSKHRHHPLKNHPWFRHFFLCNATQLALHATRYLALHQKNHGALNNQPSYPAQFVLLYLKLTHGISTSSDHRLFLALQLLTL